MRFLGSGLLLLVLLLRAFQVYWLIDWLIFICQFYLN